MNRELAPISSPYFGLQPATEREAEYFFGREEEQRIIKTNMYGQPLTVLYGPSGVGKSSLLLAAVAPQLRRPTQAVVVFRQYQDGDIAGGLKGAILEGVKAAGARGPQVDPSLPLDEFLLQCNRAVRGPIFLIFDQFESYFLHNPPSAVTDAFEAQFAKAVNRQDIDVHVLLALREDRLSDLDRFQARVNTFQNMLRVDPMTREAAAIAIRGPLEKYNELRRPPRPVGIEDGLVEALLRDVSTGPGGAAYAGAERVDTPSMQLALLTLWEKEAELGSNVLRLKTYEELGRAGHIIGSHLKQIMAGFDEPDRRLAAQMFRYLVTPGGVKIAHAAEDLTNYINEEVRIEGAENRPEVRVEDVRRVLDRLCDPGAPSDRILQKVAPPPGQPDVTRYEIFHDLLGPAILEWQSRYREQEILDAVKRQAALQREFERAKRLRWTVAAMLVVSLLLGASTLFAARARAEAERQSRLAEGRRAEAERRREEALASKAAVVEAQTQLAISYDAEKTARADAERQAHVAVEARRQAEQQKNIANEEKNKAVKAEKAEKVAADSARASAAAASAAKEEAEQKRREAVVAKVMAEQKEQEAVLAREKAEKKEKEALAARDDADKARVAEERAMAATTESINLIRAIDASAPFFGGVVRNPEPLFKATFGPDTNTIVASDGAGNVVHWKTRDVRSLPQNQQKTPRSTPPISALSGDGMLAAVADSGTVYVSTPAPGSGGSDASSQRPRYELKVPDGAFSCPLGRISSVAVASSHGRRYVAAGYENGAAAVWNLDPCDRGSASCTPVVERVHPDGVISLAFSPDGRFIATGAGAGAGAAEEGKAKECGEIPGQEGAVRNTAKVWFVDWDERGGSLTWVKTLAGHRDRVNSVAFNRPAKDDPESDKKENTLRVVTASDDATAKAWNILLVREWGEGGEIKAWKKIKSSVYTMDVYAAPRVSLAVFRQPVRKFFDYSFGLNKLIKQQVPIYAAAYSPVDDNIIVTSGAEGALRVWDIKSSSTVRIIQGHYDSVRNVAFSPGGKYLVSASEDKTVRLWNICDPGGGRNAVRSIIANLTTEKAGERLRLYCEAVAEEQLPY